MHRTRYHVDVFRCERGIALPMAMFVLVLLTSLSIAFLTLGQTEPVIGNNQLRTAQARMLAEAGVERATWALTPVSAGGEGVAPPANSVIAASPYNGLQFLTVPSGGFTVRLTGVSATEVDVDTEGWTPSVGRAAVTGYDATDTRAKAHRRVSARLMKFPDFGMNAPCALCVRGDLEIRGSAAVDSRADRSCGNKYGATTSGQLCIGGACDPADNQWGNNGSVNGATGASADDNQPDDYQRFVNPADFDGMTLSLAQLNALRAMARTLGAYYTGNTSFNSGNQIPSNKPIVFVDGNASMSGNPYQGGSFSGWFIVNGSVVMNGNGVLNGMLYAVDDIQSSSGTNTVNGLVVSQNVTNATGIDTTGSGNMTITFNCDNARGGGNLPKGWFPQPGSYKEPPG
jgi:hypothetical protein